MVDFILSSLLRVTLSLDLEYINGSPTPKAQLLTKLILKLKSPSYHQPKSAVSNTTPETPQLRLTQPTSIMNYSHWTVPGNPFNSTCVSVEESYNAITNLHIDPVWQPCVQHEDPFMNQFGQWFDVDGKFRPDLAPIYRSLIDNPTVSKEDKAWWVLGLMFPYAISGALLVALLWGYRRVQKRNGLPLTPLWVLGLWKKMKERKGFRGAKEGREIRMENLNGGAGRSEV
ncbi:MAG: hypothetical protein L6R42_004520 [Xanthoria sp. 1 TBL-2021]|nr:MAG: hypothetical protein L6R42_004520 [Xanthoria sp. 1 TBL-2021]